MFYKYICCSLVFASLFVTNSCVEQGSASADKCENEIIVTVDNFYQVSDTLYRSAQPSAEQWEELEAIGIKSVISLRYFNPGPDDVGDCAIETYALPWRTDKIDEGDLAGFLKLYAKVPKPVLVHCFHGSDRTGAAVAAYRVVYDGYTPDAAADELVNGGFGHHKLVYRNIPDLIRNADYAKIKSGIEGL